MIVTVACVSDERNMASVVTGKSSHRLFKPSVVRDTTAKQHRCRSKCLKRQRQQERYGRDPNEVPFHVIRISQLR
jgi:hypothetical protein